MLQKTVLVAILVTALCHYGQQSPNFFKGSRRLRGEPDYSGCGKTYQCFGLPDDCTDAKKCTVLLKTKPAKSGAQFNLYWKRVANSGAEYVAAALSDDNQMGNDSVTLFTVTKDGQVGQEQGYTFQYGVNAPVKTTGIDDVTFSYGNNLLVGSWVREEVSEVEQDTFNLKTNKYYVFLAVGPLKDGKPDHHTAKSMSKKAVNLEQSPAPTPKAGTTTDASTPSTAPSTVTTEPTTTEAAKKSSTTVAPTTVPGNVTETTSKPTNGSTTAPVSTTRRSTDTGTPSNATTPTPVSTTPKGSASATALSIVVTAIFALVLAIFN